RGWRWRAPRRRRGRGRGNSAHAVRAESTAAVDPRRARVAVLAARIERGERAVISGAGFLTRQVERGMARISGVLAVRGDVDGRAPELALQAEVSVVPERVEEDPEIAAGRDRRN